MISLWDDEEAREAGNDDLALRVYTSRLIGSEPDLVLHGGGNTSVKTPLTNFFGDTEEVLFVKGSGWDLATIEREGFSPVRIDALKRMADLTEMTDGEMVRAQRAAMTDPSAPTPSVEAILHAIIPFKFVDHTHADAVVTISNTPGGMERIGEIYGDRVLVVPYVMPGFILSREIYDMTRDLDWNEIEGMILLNHGVFTFGDDARSSYERMIQIVTEAESYLEREAPDETPDTAPPVLLAPDELVRLSRLRKLVSDAAGVPMVACLDDSPEAVAFSSRDDVATLATRGPLTPDHIIRTRQGAMVLGNDDAASVDTFAASYRAYFDRNAEGDVTCLDPAPRWGVWPRRGTIAMGSDDTDAGVVGDIVSHTVRAIVRAERLGGWEPLDEESLFDVEYWELEQAKLRRRGAPPPLRGKVVMVTGAASGIGLASSSILAESGACVVALDRDDSVLDILSDSDALLSLVCDVTDARQVEDAVFAAVRRFGGIDAVISNAGSFPASASIAEMNDEDWRNSLDINLDAHRVVLQRCIPFLQNGINPAVAFIGTKNVAAPGPGAGAYSVAKAALTQLARVAALELAGAGVRVNVLHPGDVFDTGLWSEARLAERAARYDMSVEAYRRRNLLGVEITSQQVAAMAVAMVGPLFSSSTGAQVSIDGGTERTV